MHIFIGARSLVFRCSVPSVEIDGAETSDAAKIGAWMLEWIQANPAHKFDFRDCHGLHIQIGAGAIAINGAGEIDPAKIGAAMIDWHRRRPETIRAMAWAARDAAEAEVRKKEGEARLAERRRMFAEARDRVEAEAKAKA